MWFDGIRKENYVYVASVSRGKDSTAMLRAIQLLNFPLDAIVSVDVWFDDETPAELPPLVEFKDEWDRKCLENFGIPVTRICAQNSNVRRAEKSREHRDDGESHSRRTYCEQFYSPHKYGNTKVAKQERDGIYGFPVRCGAWCNSKLKVAALTEENIFRYILQKEQQWEEKRADSGIPDGPWELVYSRTEAIGNERKFTKMRLGLGAKTNIVHYIGIAADEPKRIERHMKDPKKVLPLVQIGWDEALCGLEAQYFDMLSPTYDTSMRDGCWFCHNQGIDQLRNLRKNYPDLWEKLLKLDLDSPISFKTDGHTVHDYDRRFQMEEDGWIDIGKPFKWSLVEKPKDKQLSIFD